MEQEYRCTKCEAILNNQDGFSPDLTFWTCNECGEQVDLSEQTDESDSSNGIAGVLDSLTQIINNSVEFASLFAPGDEEESNDWDEDNSEWDDDEFDEGFDEYDGLLSDDDIDSAKDDYCLMPDKEYRALKRRIAFDEFIDGLKKVGIVFVVVLGLICILGLIRFGDAMIHGITIDVSNEQYSSTNYEDLEYSLKEKGFFIVNTSPICDLKYEEIENENSVAYIKVGGKLDTNGTKKYSKWSIVTIYYHMPQRAEIPFSSKDVKGQNIDDVKEQFADAGYGNIVLDVEYDVFFGKLVSPGEVKCVVIDSDKKYSKGDEYPVDAEIKITYHEYHSKKPKS